VLNGFFFGAFEKRANVAFLPWVPSFVAGVPGGTPRPART
jgi:hypothetical protein